MRRLGTLATVAFVTIAVAFAVPLSASGFEEPNDSVPAAVGPLESGGGYRGTIEVATDRDFYFFYVTSPGEVAVSLTLANEGGGSVATDLEMRIIDSLGTSLGHDLAFLRKGESRAESLTLPAGKYFAEVAANEGGGDSYRLTPGGGEGAFGSYHQIATRCAAATSRSEGAAVVLRRAEARLQRSRSRYRRSRYNGREARRKARAAVLEAKANLRQAKAERAAAEGSRMPWCAIPA